MQMTEVWVYQGLVSEHKNTCRNVQTLALNCAHTVVTNFLCRVTNSAHLVVGPSTNDLEFAVS